MISSGTDKPADVPVAVDPDRLMVRIQQGDVAAFESLVTEFELPLQRFFMANTNDGHLAEDLAQETLLRVSNKAWNYIPCGRFRGWLFRIARNLLVDSIRDMSRDALVHSVRVFGGSDDVMVIETLEFDGRASLRSRPDHQVASAENVARIRDLILEIPEEQRLVMTLVEQTDMMLSEIATALEIPLGTCKSRLRLARQRLAELLGQYGMLSDKHPVVRRWARPVLPRADRGRSRSNALELKKPVTI